MNVYDKAYELAKSFEEDEQIIEYKQITEELKKNTELEKKITDFRTKRTAFQIETIQNGKIDEKKEQEIKKIYQELLAEEIAAKFFASELKVNVLVSDIQKIIFKDLKDLL